MSASLLTNIKHLGNEFFRVSQISFVGGFGVRAGLAVIGAFLFHI